MDWYTNEMEVLAENLLLGMGVEICLMPNAQLEIKVNFIIII